MGKYFRIPPPAGQELYWDRQGNSMRWALRDHRGDVHAEIVATSREWIVTAVSRHEGYAGIAVALDLSHEGSALHTAQRVGESLALLTSFRMTVIPAVAPRKKSH